MQNADTYMPNYGTFDGLTENFSAIIDENSLDPYEYSVCLANMKLNGWGSEEEEA